ncbi:hypothetical protein SAMN04490194_4859 [Pseudomonas migulae]|uniref:Uncharacterized protein n=1 Tax=Pseudomonas migulae TaxID=78543 RepID=A0A1H5MN16_9PSED|nr:hypothetical protein SAMN04490194_4859 [Pseudomonas migulae]
MLRAAPTGGCVSSMKKGQTCEGLPLFLLREPNQSVSIRECLRVSFMVMYTSNDTAMHAVTYQ